MLVLKATLIVQALNPGMPDEVDRGQEQQDAGFQDPLVDLTILRID